MRAICFGVYIIVVTTLVKPFKNSKDSCVVNVYRIGNFIMALALPLTINNLGYF